LSHGPIVAEGRALKLKDMPAVLATQTVPLVAGGDGVIHVEGTRVPLETVVAAFENGATAEEIRPVRWLADENFEYEGTIDAYGTLPYRWKMENKATTARLEARLPADVHAMLKRAAEMQGRTLTDCVVSAARDAALRTIEEAEILRLSAEDQRLIATAILNPPEPSPALRRAFQRRHELFGLA